MSRFTFITIFIIVFLLSILIYFHFLSPYQIGIKSGILKDIVNRGYIFKTYEGELQTSTDTLNFSVDKSSLADSLMHYQGKYITIQYEQFKGSLPWRGESKMIVTTLLNVQDSVSAIKISH
jgi:hypothetical protein